MDPSTNNTSIFKCDRHAANISEQLMAFYEGNEFFDTVLVAGNDSIMIHGHKIVLTALSGYFLQLFREGQTATSKDNVVKLKELEAPTLKLVIDFMYSGWIELSIEKVANILKTASFLKMKTLTDGCIRFIETHTISLTNCLNWLKLAKELNLSELKEKSLNWIYTHFEEVSKEKELLLLNEEELKDLLFNDNPHGDFEEHVFLCMTAWIGYDKANRQHLTFELLSMVRYQFLTPKFIIKNRKPVCKTLECYELICSWLQWHLVPETRSEDEQNDDLKPRKVERMHIVKVFDSEKIEIEAYNEQLDTWSVEKQIQLRRKKSNVSIIVIDKKLLVVGGKTENNVTTNEVECFDLDTGLWSDLPPMRRSRKKCLLENIDGKLCVFCGIDESDTLADSVEIFNFSTRQWCYTMPPSKPSKDSRIVVNNRILYHLDFENCCMQSYDDSSKRWTLKALQKEKLGDFRLASVGDYLYVIGGCKQGVYVETVERYNLSNQTWEEVAPVPELRSFPKINVIGNKIFICGRGSGGILFEKYDKDTNSWKTMSHLPGTEFYVATLYSS